MIELRDISIRKATEEELSALIALDHVAEGDGDRRKSIEAAIRSHRTWTVRTSESIVGYGIISHDFFSRTFIELIYIAEAERSKGHGPKLIQFLESQTRTSDLFTSTNESNVHMQHVLEKLGYERSGVIHNLDPGDPEIVYIKRNLPT